LHELLIVGQLLLQVIWREMAKRRREPLLREGVSALAELEVRFLIDRPRLPQG
jgi:hypothetical protein